MLRLVPLAVLVLVLAACHGELVPVPGQEGADAGAAEDAVAADDPELTWERHVGPMMGARGCVPCHGDGGSYSVETYAAALGPGSDAVPNVIPGDASSLLLTYSLAGHGGLGAADLSRLRGWIVDADARER
jgi:mono/diheme cytochrome c family protein